MATRGWEVSRCFLNSKYWNYGDLKTAAYGQYGTKKYQQRVAD